MPVKQYQIKELKDLKPFIETRYRPKLEEVINLYSERKIVNYSTAFKLARGLAGNTGAPKAAIKVIDKYYDVPTVRGRLKRETEENKLKTYFVKGVVHTTSKYAKTTNKGRKEYDKEYHDEFQEAKEIRARSDTKAREIFEALARDDFGVDGYSKKTHVDRVVITSTTLSTTYTAKSEADVQMKAVKFPKYHFIPSDDKLLKNDGFCVPDQFVGKYGPKIPRLTVPYFISLCEEFYGVTKMTLGESVDIDINYDSSDDVIPKKKNWDISQGVSPKCLTYICTTLNISCYSFDITQKCFMKFVAPCRNYDALVYYCVNNHMYWISDQKAALCLTRRAREVEHKIKSVALPEEFEK